ncbi:MAG: S8 family peptidase [Bacteroidia bacterium]|nr:S8 family peptidase [Bacteroidia bacterium]
MFRLFLYITLVLGFFSQNNIQAQPLSQRPWYYDGVLYLKIRNESNLKLTPFSDSGSSEKLQNPEKFTQIFSQYGVTKLFQPFKTPTPTIQRIYELNFSQVGRTEELINALQSLKDVEFAERKPIMYSMYKPNDPRYTQSQAYLKVVKAEQAWDIHRPQMDILLAVVDDACAITHEDLQEAIWTNPNEIPDNGIDDDMNLYVDDVNGYDVADMDNDPNPPSNANFFLFSHGTHTCGIAGAVTDNGIGVASLGYNLAIMPVKAAQDTSGGQTIQAGYEGLDYAMRTGARVISMSWGGPGRAGVHQALINSAIADYDIALIAAAGNDNDTLPIFPGDYRYVIKVGATENNDTKASYSNYAGKNSRIDVCAPGSNILSSVPGTMLSYFQQSGTSMSTPLVASLVGMMRSYKPDYKATQIINCLKSSCDDISAKNPDYIGRLGAGRINAANALACLSQTAIDSQNQPLKFNVLPNPVENRLHIIGNEGIKGVVYLYNLLGKRVLEYPLSGSYDTEISVDTLSPSVYFLEVVTDQGTYSQKIIKR